MRAKREIELHDWYEIEQDGEWKLFQVTCLIWGTPFGRWGGDGPGPIEMPLEAKRRKASAPQPASTSDMGGGEELDPLRKR
jgi:hypothetical protein